MRNLRTSSYEIAFAFVVALLLDHSLATVIATVLVAAAVGFAGVRGAWAIKAVQLAPIALALLAGSIVLHSYNGAVAYRAWSAVDLAIGIASVVSIAAVAFDLGGSFALVGAGAWALGWCGVGALELRAVTGVGTFPDLVVYAPLMLAIGAIVIAIACTAAVSQASLAVGCLIVAAAAVYGYLRPFAGGGAAFAAAALALAVVIARWLRVRDLLPMPRAAIADSR